MLGEEDPGRILQFVIAFIGHVVTYSHTSEGRKAREIWEQLPAKAFNIKSLSDLPPPISMTQWIFTLTLEGLTQMSNIILKFTENQGY